MADYTAGLNDTTGVTDVISKIGLKLILVNAVDITDYLRKIPTVSTTETVGVSDSLSVSGVFVQYDSWRPVPKPDNTMTLVCRTPEGDHDTTLTDLSIWAVNSEEGKEAWSVLSVAENGYGWDGFGHPEWSPDGSQIVLFAETATEYQIVILGASGFGQY